MKTQKQLYYEAVEKSARLNEIFLEMVQDGMTRKELEILINKRPDVYSRFANWLPRSPLNQKEL